MNDASRAVPPGLPETVVATLLLLSRERLGDDLDRRARHLLGSITDWPLLFSTAADKQSLPFLYSHVLRLCPHGPPPEVMSEARALVLGLKARSMALHAALRGFHGRVVAPVGPRNVYVKGPAQAVRYFDDPHLRVSRDVDILVAKEDLGAVVRRAIAEGYRPVADAEGPSFARSDRDVRALMRFGSVVQLVSPENVTIEVHTSIDEDQGLFDPEAMIASSEEIAFGDLTLRILRPEMLFCYLCYHHTRHTWSRLHWLADLHAVADHPGFDPAAVRSVAADTGMTPLVEACLGLRDLSTAYPAKTPDAPGSGEALLSLCVRNLGRDLEFERSLRGAHHLSGLPFGWLLEPRARRRAVGRRLARMLAPNHYQYRTLPLPEALHWTYYLTKPAFGLWRRLAGKPRQAPLRDGADP